MKTCFTEEDMKIASKYMRRCSTSLAPMDMQFKTTVTYHYPSISMAKKNPKIVIKSSAGKDPEK